MSFEVKDSGDRMEFESGMVRDTSEGKADYSLVYDGPMLDRWAEHLSKGAVKYSPRNWMLAQGDAEAERFRASAARHFRQWMRGDQDEDHAAAVFFNINGHEYVKAREQDAWLAVSAETLPEDDWTPPVKAQPATYVGPKRRTLEELGPVNGNDLMGMLGDEADQFADDYNYMRERVLELEKQNRSLETQLAVQSTLVEALYRH